RLRRLHSGRSSGPDRISTRRPRTTGCCGRSRRGSDCPCSARRGPRSRSSASGVDPKETAASRGTNPGDAGRDLLRAGDARPGAGASLVEPIRSARRALPYVLYHHERWDGGGYPTGMRGGEIPIEARVIAVADAFDAMTSPRPYPALFTTERALEEVDRCSGTQFDPTVAEAFLEIWSRGVLGDLPAAAAF